MQNYIALHSSLFDSYGTVATNPTLIIPRSEFLSRKETYFNGIDKGGVTTESERKLC
jgi:hypothetical protein